MRLVQDRREEGKVLLGIKVVRKSNGTGQEKKKTANRRYPQKSVDVFLRLHQKLKRDPERRKRNRDRLQPKIQGHDQRKKGGFKQARSSKEGQAHVTSEEASPGKPVPHL
ncbi:hypothetical protein TNIN_350111 [Trichonephila inaurata madagascariensis]|uniref:Uncharacterized protein n=1 Tax=Trichonephila inaurata madagascariensis TaxID=2747483 RepID=A0A8X6KJ00_9ARAC|nr:hypothetical protein TNIN_350111 [Trichonephila inaurata madagascariensis]